MTAPELLARRFHNLYEHMAPQFGYTTREDTRLFIPESPNGKLMIAVCEALASSPEVATMIAEARREERERCAAILDTYETIDAEIAAIGIRRRVDLPAEIAATIRALKEDTHD